MAVYHNKKDVNKNGIILAVQIKKGILKKIGFYTTKDIAGLTDIKVKIINYL